MTGRQPAPDQAQRDRIVTDLASTLFVQAGAGSGKTSALVDRVVSLVSTGTAELRSIAAVTFTEKAGAELRDRIRRELEERAEQTDDPAIADALRELRGALPAGTAIIAGGTAAANYAQALTAIGASRFGSIRELRSWLQRPITAR